MRRYIPLTLLLIFALTASIRAENAVRFTDAVVEPGGEFSVEMLIENDVLLGGATVPFRWTSPDISFDSVVVNPGRWQGDIRVIYQQTNFTERFSAVTFIRSLVPGETGWIPVGSESIATLYFSVSGQAQAQYAFVDSVYHVVNDLPLRWVNWSSYSGGLIAPAVYPGRITIGDPGTASMIISPGSITFHGESGDLSPVSRILEIRSNSGLELDWSATWEASWIEISPPNGHTPAFPVIYADPFMLEPGEYRHSITITSPIAENSPLTIPVYFIVDTQTVDPPEGFNFSLGQSKPSPFVAYSDPETRIPFLLEEPSHVVIELFDILGRRIKTLTSASYDAGEAEVIWDGRDARGEAVASGHYICRMTAEGGESSRVIVLIR